MNLRLAALIVNFDSGSYALALARAVRQQWLELGAANADLEIVVVDNASNTDQGRELAALQQFGARVVQSAQNLGYAAGMNLALAQTRGSDSDLVLVLNPDLALFPGALGRLLGTQRETPGAGAIGPRAFLEPTGTWRMPPNRLPTPEGEWLAARALREPELARALSNTRTQHALREWTAIEPTEVEMLSGACLLLSRRAIASAGGLFDERYPLYFEDTDLCMRLSRAGLALVFEPRAEIVHHWARSSGIERGDSEPGRRRHLSRDAYFERWFGAEARGPLALADALVGASAVFPPGEFRELGECHTAPSFEFSGSGTRLLEIAMVPSFPLAAGALVGGASWRMDERAFEWFYRGRYFARALDSIDPSGPVHRADRGPWSFLKPSPARVQPLSPLELERGVISKR